MNKAGYALATIKMSKIAASGIFKLAINNRVMDYNPVPPVKLPQDAPAEKRRALTPEEQSWINSPTEHRARRAAMIMMYAGLRRGELIPLLWDAIDLTEKTISVNKAVEIINGRSVLKNKTKTDAGMRTAYIPQKLADYLAGERRESIYVCPSAKGDMMSESAWKRLWDSYLSELNFRFGDFDAAGIEKPSSRFAPQKIPFVIPRITAHWLRHTFITFMYLAGVDILTAKEQAGHADIKTTMEIYTHLDSIHKVKQINKLDEFLSSGR
jgi:integrase